MRGIRGHRRPLLAEEVVTTFRTLAATDPGRYQPALAAAVINLGEMRSGVGLSAAALEVTGDAVAIRRAWPAPILAAIAPISPPHSSTWSYRCWS
jgi:hypothetical protein